MISVEDALAACLALVRPTGSERVSLAQAAGRVLAADVVAARDQPPFAAAAMDGYAVAQDDRVAGRRLQVVRAAPAGHAWAGQIARGQDLRQTAGIGAFQLDLTFYPDVPLRDAVDQAPVFAFGVTI